MYSLSRDKPQNKKPFVILTELTLGTPFHTLYFIRVLIMVDFYAAQTKKFIRFIKVIHPFMTYSVSVNHRYSQEQINL